MRNIYCNRALCQSRSGKLGHMGVLVEKSLTPTIWVEHHVAKFPFGSNRNEKYKLAKPYLDTLIGGMAGKR